MTLPRHPFVLFAAAAGPELGFGHLVRCGVLADVLHAPRELALRGSATARLAALRLGWTVHQGQHLERALLPDLIVVDEPSAAHRGRWVRLARLARIPVAVLCDGDSNRTDADVVIDGSFIARPDHRGHRCAGPAWAVLSPTIPARRQRPLLRDRDRVFVALGGGAHVARLGVAIARAIVTSAPQLRVDLASGFTGATGVPLPRGCRWVHAPSGLADHLGSAGTAVVAGGVTLYEACALGTPVVAVPVVEAQRPAIEAAVAAGAAVTVPRGAPAASATAVAAAVRELFEHRGHAAARAAIAAALVDGAGAMRVAARLRHLVRTYSGGARHAA
jgi:spore coat polysaccharide biosynthesis predicted glycosyltransferase SpsG